MLSLRPPQLEALGHARRVELEQRLHAHVCRTLPATTRGMSDAEIRDAVHHGVSRALAHGIDTERGVCKYVNLVFVLGRDFDRDPRLPWAREILEGARVHRGLSTIELLYREALAHEARGEALAHEAREGERHGDET